MNRLKYLYLISAEYNPVIKINVSRIMPVSIINNRNTKIN